MPIRFLRLPRLLFLLLLGWGVLFQGCQGFIDTGLPPGDEATDDDSTEAGDDDSTSPSDDDTPPSPPSWSCIPGFSMAFSPETLHEGEVLSVDITGDYGAVYVGLSAAGPGGTVQGEWGGVEGTGPFIWSYTFSSLGEGLWNLTYTADSGATWLCEASLTVLAEEDLPPTDDDDEFDLPPITASGGAFWEEGHEFRFVGANARGLIHYGHPDLLPYSAAGDRAAALDTGASIGFTVLRVFAANHHISPEETASRLALALDEAASRGIRLLVSLTDFYPTGFCPQGEEGWYAVDPNGWTTLSHEFFDHGWTGNYQGFLTTVISSNQGHPGLFAWELGNEIKDAWYPDTFLQFLREAGDVVNSLDGATLLTTGSISSASNGFNASQATTYASLAQLDFLNEHIYEGVGGADLALAGAAGKPYVVEEAGYSLGDRPSQTEIHANSMFDGGAAGYLQWGYVAVAWDNGDGDWTYGMDPFGHGADWEAFLNTYAGLASSL